MKSIRIPFSFEEGEVLTTNSVDTVVKQEIVNYFMTVSGERVMNATYGGNLPRLIFEINDPLVLADYKLDAVSEANANLSYGKVIDMFIDDTPNDDYYDTNVAKVNIRYAVAPRTISTVKLVVDATFTEESEI